MDDDDDGPPMLVDAEGNEADEATLATDMKEAKVSKVPISIITGYLGAGKSTLLDYILTARHGKKIAVILNEFGNTAALDPLATQKPLTISGESGESQTTDVLNLSNGCICCSIKDQGVNALESLMAKRGMFDYILLETTGLADPGNIAPAFWVDDGLGSDVFLDGIVTMVDAVNLLRSLEDPVGEEEVQQEDDEGHMHFGPRLSVAHLQISHADVVVVNKTDLVSEEQLEKVVSRVRSINALAKIHVTTYGKVPELEGVVLDLHAYDDVGKEALKAFAEKGHSHLDPAMGTVGVTFPVLDEKKMASLDEWLRKVLWTSTLPGKEEEKDAWEVHRSKGRIVGPGGMVKMLQGVREIFEMTDAADGSPSEESEEQGRIVFIGRGLGGENVPNTFQSSLDEVLGLR